MNQKPKGERIGVRLFSFTFAAVLPACAGALHGQTLNQPAAQTTNLRTFAATFKSPPDDARPMVRWWWFGPAATRPELARELQQMKQGGFGGFEIQPVYPLALDGRRFMPQDMMNLKPRSLAGSLSKLN